MTSQVQHEVLLNNLLETINSPSHFCLRVAASIYLPELLHFTFAIRVLPMEQIGSQLTLLLLEVTTRLLYHGEQIIDSQRNSYLDDTPLCVFYVCACM